MVTQASPKWLNTNEYPFAAKYFQTNSHNLHYIDEGSGETIVFVHGTPSWSFDYRHCIVQLSKTFRCVAMDHIGFGLSDKPAEYDYSTPNHAATLGKLIAHLQLENVTLVVHDFGGPIGLHWAINNADKLKRMVILNSWMWSSNGEPEFEKLKRILKSPLLPCLYKQLNFSPKIILPASFGEKKLAASLRAQYTKPFADSSQRNGALAFAHSLLNDQPWFEQLWNEKKTIADKPVQFIWGMRDKVIGPKYLDKFISGFSNHRVLKLDTCGHFPQEEEHAAVTQCIYQFMQLS
ncbi:MAG: alpha/beta fold hydrolase [Flavobacteriales bacterium]